MASASISSTAPSLLTLPDACLAAVLQWCAQDDNPATTLRGAAAHSRLHQAAVIALSSITKGVADQAHLSVLLRYLTKHGRHVRTLWLHEAPAGGGYILYGSPRVQLRELPASLTQLNTLQLDRLSLQLQRLSSGSPQGVLRAGLPALTRLELHFCSLQDGAQGLEAALMQLPSLQHLSISHLTDDVATSQKLAALPSSYLARYLPEQRLVFPTHVLVHIAQLTRLQLAGVDFCDREEDSSSDAAAAALQPLQALKVGVDDFETPYSVNASMLSGATQLSWLLVYRLGFEAGALAGKAQLQHLVLSECYVGRLASPLPPRPSGVAQLLVELQQLTQLRYLNLSGSCCWRRYSLEPSPPPAAFAALTASSRLQHLVYSSNMLPAAAWQHVFPAAGRTLPQLRSVDISHLTDHGPGERPLVPDTSNLVSCCPGLEDFSSSMPCSTAVLAPLQRMSSLTVLTVGAGRRDGLEGVQALCQLTRLRSLSLSVSSNAALHMLELTQL